METMFKEVSYKQYLDGDYVGSVENACKEINDRLKAMYKKHKKEELDGQDLFDKVFNDDMSKALLKVAHDMTIQSSKDEQAGYRFLLMGMWSALRNIKEHENPAIEKEVAYSNLIFTSMLMEKIDQAFLVMLSE